MSFDKPPASYPFMEFWVKEYGPAASGVYILFSTPGFTWEVIYVGEAEDMQKRLLGHLEGDHPCITRRGPTAFICETIEAGRRLQRRNELTGEYNPTCS